MYTQIKFLLIFDFSVRKTTKEWLVYLAEYPRPLACKLYLQLQAGKAFSGNYKP